MIRVSDLTTYLKCPRIAYFINRGHDLKLDLINPERIILKELALVYPLAVGKKAEIPILDTLKGELDRISNEIHAIYRAELAGINEEIVVNSVTGVQSYLPEISSNLPADFYSNPDVDYEPVLQSEKFGLTGTPDKLVTVNGQILPSIIKTGKMPENGIWSSDRLQLTAYSMLVEEKYNSVVERGFVEYAKWGEVREVAIKRHERRKIFQIIEKIKKIQQGSMPEKPGNASCEACGFIDMCEVKPTLASRFF